MNESIKYTIYVVIIVFIVVSLIQYYNLFSFEGIEGIATLITALLVLYTLFEMKYQRESMYKPDIILNGSGRFYIYSERNGNFAYLPSLWVNEELAEEKIISIVRLR